MFFLLLFLFIVLPFVELTLLLKLGALWGAGPTLGLILLTGVVGAFLARQQGLRVWRELHQDLAQGRPPANALWDAALVLIAGAVLVTPGVITDAFGFALLIPPFRRLLGRVAKAHMSQRFHVTDMSQSITPPFPAVGFPAGPGREEVKDIQAEVRDVDVQVQDAPSG